MPLLTNSPPEVNAVAFDSQANYQFWIQNSDLRAQRDYEQELVQALMRSAEPYLLIAGYCSYCQQSAHFLLDSIDSSPVPGSDLFEPNWRERLICSRCNLNNRNRFLWNFLSNFPTDANVWLVDQSSSMLPTLSKRFSQLNHKAANSKSNQSLADFPANTFRLHISLEILNSIADLTEYLSQAYRTLDRNGRFVATFPFALNEKISQTTSQNSRLIGWDILEQLRSIGFIDVQFVSGWSREYLHLGPAQFFLYATK